MRVCGGFACITTVIDGKNALRRHALARQGKRRAKAWYNVRRTPLNALACRVLSSACERQALTGVASQAIISRHCALCFRQVAASGVSIRSDESLAFCIHGGIIGINPMTGWW